jgi:hypothetical protein
LYLLNIAHSGECLGGDFFRQWGVGSRGDEEDEGDKGAEENNCQLSTVNCQLCHI